MKCTLIHTCYIMHHMKPIKVFHESTTFCSLLYENNHVHSRKNKHKTKNIHVVFLKVKTNTKCTFMLLRYIYHNILNTNNQTHIKTIKLINSLNPFLFNFVIYLFTQTYGKANQRCTCLCIL